MINKMKLLDKFFMALMPCIEEGGDTDPISGGAGGGEGEANDFDSSTATAEQMMHFQTEQPLEKPDGAGQEPTGKEGEPTGDKPTGTPAEPEGSDKKDAKDLEQPPKAGEGEVPAKEKAPATAWSEEQMKFFTDKGVGEVPFSESTAKLFGIHQDAEKRVTELSQNNSQINSSFGEIGKLIQGNDIQGIVDVAERAFGTKLDIETRTPDDHIKEHTDNYMSVLNQFKPVYENLRAVAQTNPEQATVLNQVADLIIDNLNTMHAGAEAKIGVIQSKQLARSEARLAAGLPEKGEKSNLYANLSTNAENAFTDLRKLDPNADKYIDHVKALTGEGSPMAAAGMSLAKAFGFNGQLSNEFYKIGKAMETQRAFDSGDIEKALYAKWTKEKAGMIDGVPDGGTRPAAPAGDSDDWNAKMQKYAATGAM